MYKLEISGYYHHKSDNILIRYVNQHDMLGTAARVDDIKNVVSDWSKRLASDYDTNVFSLSEITLPFLLSKKLYNNFCLEYWLFIDKEQSNVS
jgi:hypothetical protein